MEFYRLDEVPKRPREVVFRESRLKEAILFCFFGLLGAGALALAVAETLSSDQVFLPLPVAYLVAGGLSVFVLVSLASLRGSLASTNWLLRYTVEGLVIKFRSYLNRRLPPEDVVAFFLPRSEIAWVRKTREVRLVPDEEGEHSEYWTYLDIKLSAGHTAALEDHLRRERLRETPKWKFHHYPVRLLPEGIVRLEWRGSSSWVVPGVDKALKVLSFSVPIERALFLKPRRPATANAQEMETRILELAERGNTMAAVNLVKRQYGWDTKTAMEFVESLVSRPSLPGLNSS